MSSGKVHPPFAHPTKKLARGRFGPRQGHADTFSATGRCLPHGSNNLPSGTLTTLSPTLRSVAVANAWAMAMQARLNAMQAGRMMSQAPWLWSPLPAVSHGLQQRMPLYGLPFGVPAAATTPPPMLSYAPRRDSRPPAPAAEDGPAAPSFSPPGEVDSRANCSKVEKRASSPCPPPADEYTSPRMPRVHKCQDTGVDWAILDRVCGPESVNAVPVANSAIPVPKQVEELETRWFKGITHCKPTQWRAKIFRRGRSVNLGHYSNPALAALAYDIAARALPGQRSTSLNFSDGQLRRLAPKELYVSVRTAITTSFLNPKSMTSKRQESSGSSSRKRRRSTDADGPYEPKTRKQRPRRR